MTKTELTTSTAMQAGQTETNTVTATTLADRLGTAADKGLYNPSREHDACGVGFVAHMKGAKSHKIVADGLQVLENLTHRGAVGADPLMGDGAGMLVQIPHGFFEAEMSAAGTPLPEFGGYGVGFIFLPQDDVLRAKCEEIVERVIKAEGQELIGWRDVPVDNASLSKAPDIAATEPGLLHRLAVEPDHRLQGHVPRLSARRLLQADLKDERFTSALALVHQRFSTNTFPSWKLSHPYRMVATTARSTRCAATSTGWRRARRRSPTCSATTSPSSGRSPMKASRTRPASTMRWNSWSWAATRCPCGDDADPGSLGRQPADG
jgi:glutamate synthase (NADPH/NADH) large chain